jgi:endo-1,4-beta-xylanase
LKKYADDNGMVFRGHAIAWGAQTPAWLDGLSPADKKAALINHINTVLPRYGNIAWDIANESIADDQ